MYDDLFFLPPDSTETVGEASDPREVSGGGVAPRDGLTQLKGSVEHIIYCNEDNG